MLASERATRKFQRRLELLKSQVLSTSLTGIIAQTSNLPCCLLIDSLAVQKKACLQAVSRKTFFWETFFFRPTKEKAEIDKGGRINKQTDDHPQLRCG